MLFAVSSLAQAVVPILAARAPVVTPRVASTPVAPKAVSTPKPVQQVQRPVVTSPVIAAPVVHSSCKDKKDKCK